jgi:hypothetical protein
MTFVLYGLTIRSIFALMQREADPRDIHGLGGIAQDLKKIAPVFFRKRLRQTQCWGSNCSSVLGLHMLCSIQKEPPGKRAVIIS